MLYTEVSLASLWYRRPHVRMRMSIGYLEPLVLFFLIIFFWCHICACKFMPARQLLQLCKERIINKNNFFFQFLAGFELATSESAVQCLIHWATAENLNIPLQKLIFNCQARSQGPRIFSRWQPLFRASSKCLRPVSIMLATATPQSPAIKRPLENLEP